MPYNLLHYFASHALLRGEDDHTAARWIGTIVAMIERTYNKIKLRMVVAKLADRRRSEAGELLLPTAVPAIAEPGARFSIGAGGRLIPVARGEGDRSDVGNWQPPVG